MSKLFLRICLVIFSYAVSSVAQELPARQSFGSTATFAATSSHILIGTATDRRIWTAGFEYGLTLLGNHTVRLEYEGSVSPFFLECDPRFSDVYAVENGIEMPAPYTPGRVVSPVSGILGYENVGTSQPVPVYARYGTEESYAFTASPVGVRANGFNSHKLQPSFSLDLGIVLSGRSLPIDDASRRNYMFSFGPGLEFFYQRNASVRVEYLYRHISNANSAQENPGIDQGVFRLTFTHRR